MKKYVYIFLSLLLVFVMTMPVMAEGDLPRLVDDADLLTDHQEQALLAKLDMISEKQHCDVVIVTQMALHTYSAQAEADDFFDNNHYGENAGDDGILFLLAMEDRDWAISTYGFGIQAFTDRGQEYIMEMVLPDLSAGAYDRAFATFADQADYFLTKAREGNPLDKDSPELKEPFSVGKSVAFSVVLGLASAGIAVAVMKGKLNSVAKRTEARQYVRSGSLSIIESRDMFLYHTVTKTKRESSSSGGGGSSTHKSSSGRSHGGSSGKF